VTADAVLGCLWLQWNVAKTVAAIVVRIVVPLVRGGDDD